MYFFNIATITGGDAASSRMSVMELVLMTNGAGSAPLMFRR
jgi:hypothetical protein